MNNKCLKIIFTVSLLLGISNISQAQAGWFGKPVKGQIVDKETKKPIKDVLVIATWNKRHLLEPANTGKVVDAREILTDANGMFDFKTKTGVNYFRRVHLYFYKKGYKLGRMRFKNIDAYYNYAENIENTSPIDIIGLEKLSEGKSEAGARTAIRSNLGYRYEHISGEKPYKFAKKIPKAIEIIKSR